MRIAWQSLKRLFVLLLTWLLLPHVAPAGTLSPYAEAVGTIIKFDRDVLFAIKEHSGKSIQRMAGYDESGFQIVVDGVFVPVAAARTESVLCLLRKKLAPLNYMAFVIDRNESIKTDKIGVLKGNDQYRILNVMHTEGKEYDISHDDVVQRLKEWEKTSTFVIIGAGHDWVELDFRRLPKNLKLFAEEVYDFCPAIHQSAGSAAALAGALQRTKRLLLRWD